MPKNGSTSEESKALEGSDMSGMQKEGHIDTKEQEKKSSVDQ